MSFASDITRFNAKTLRLTEEVFAGAADEAFRSVVEGSEITGAPGQPVASGKMKESWKQVRVSPTEIAIVTNDGGAPAVEDNWSNGTFKTGGPHSLKLTEAGWPRIVEHVAQKVAK